MSFINLENYGVHIEKTKSIFNSIDLVDESYNSLISIMNLLYSKRKDGAIEFGQHGGELRSSKKSVRQIRKTTRDPLFSAFKTGIYYPATERNYLIGEVDLKNDVLIDEGSIRYLGDTKLKNEFMWTTIYKRKGIKESDFIFSTQKDNIECFYEVNNFSVNENIKKHRILLWTSFLCITKQGKIIPCISKSSLRKDARYAIIGDSVKALHHGAGAISLLSDRQYLWLVETSEEYNENNIAKVQFGISEHEIKSLLFAREEPLTETGRKKPILHWVNSHKRRLKNNIDIDIDKYLRGITEFKMGELNFKITQPVKEIKSAG